MKNFILLLTRLKLGIPFNSAKIQLLVIICTTNISEFALEAFLKFVYSLRILIKIYTFSNFLITRIIFHVE